MDESTLLRNLATRPPADPVYLPSLDPSEPASLATAVWPRSTKTAFPVLMTLASLALLLALLVGAALLGGSATAPPSAPATRLLYQDEGGSYVAELDGDASRIRAELPFIDGYVPSPDGRALALIARGDAGASIQTVDGSGKTSTLTRVAAASSLTWSPDAQRLSYDAPADPDCGYPKANDGIGDAVDRDSQWGPVTRGGGNDPSLPCDVDIYVVAPGSSAIPIASSPGRDTSPAWSPDGERIAYVSDRGGTLGDVYTMAPDGSTVTRISSGGGFAPVWSPDGTRIAYFDAPLVGGPYGGFTQRRLIVVDADGSHPTVVAVPSYAQQIAWSPDGRQLAYTAYASAGDNLSRRVLVVSADGGTPRPLVTAASPWARLAQFDPAWSPDGTTIALTIASSGGHEWGAGSIGLTSLESGTTKVVSIGARQPRWIVAASAADGPSPTDPILAQDEEPVSETRHVTARASQDGPALDLAIDVPSDVTVFTNAYLLRLDRPEPTGVQIWWRVGGVHGDACRGRLVTPVPNASVGGLSPSEAYEVIRSASALVVSDETPLDLAGVTGRSVDITIHPDRAIDCVYGSAQLTYAAKGRDAGGIRLSLDEMLRLATIEVDGLELLIAINGANVEELDRASVILETLDIQSTGAAASLVPPLAAMLEVGVGRTPPPPE